MLLPEVDEMLRTLERCKPDQLTGAFPWTVHELTAHLAAGADEVVRHLEALLDEAPMPRTRVGDEREAPFRELPDAELRKVLRSGQERLVAVLDNAMTRDPNATFPFSLGDVPVWAMVTHVRLEAAMHRWDLVGDDDINDLQLTAPDLTGYSVMGLGSALLERGAAGHSGPTETFVLRAPAQPDVVIQAGEGSAAMVLQPQSDQEAGLEADPASRLLLLWGRRSTNPGRLRRRTDRARLDSLAGLLLGF